MEFMIWATRSLHVFSAVVWLGGLLYLGGILHPVFRHERMTTTHAYVAVERRFLSFIWMSVWTTAITGVLLMLFSQKFQFGSYRTTWEYLLFVKQFIYLAMVLLAISTGDIVRKMEHILASALPSELESQLSVQHDRMVVRRRWSTVFGLVVLLISTQMVMA